MELLCDPPTPEFPISPTAIRNALDVIDEIETDKVLEIHGVSELVEDDGIKVVDDPKKLEELNAMWAESQAPSFRDKLADEALKYLANRSFSE